MRSWIVSCPHLHHEISPDYHPVPTWLQGATKDVNISVNPRPRLTSSASPKLA